MMHGFILGAWFACQALDTGSTLAALQRPNVTEANPVMRGSRALPLRVGINLGVLLAYHRASKPQRALLGSALAVSGCVAGSWNLAQLRRLP